MSQKIQSFILWPQCGTGIFLACFCLVTIFSLTLLASMDIFRPRFTDSLIGLYGFQMLQYVGQQILSHLGLATYQLGLVLLH